MRYAHIFLIIGLMILLSVLGCSGGKSPVLPSGTGQKTDSTPIDIFQESTDPSPYFSAGLLGIFSGHIDAANLTGELVPFRDMQNQDVLEVVDLTNFLHLAPCTNCVKVHSVQLDSDNHLVVNIGIRHPFPLGDPLKPPTGRNRLDLHVFNIEGIVAMTSSTSVSFPGLNAKTDSNGLLNASGYTGYLDTLLDQVMPTDATTHPYILHFRDYSNGNYDPVNPNGFADVQNPSGYLVMRMGCDEDVQPYIFNLSSTGSIDFTYAIGCTYGISAESKSKRLSPTYRLPQFNKKAASEVAVEIVSNDLKPNLSSSSAVLHVKVLDMNQGIAAGEGIGDMRAESNIANISVELPGITTSPVVTANPTAIGGDPRNPSDPLTFEMTITNNASGPAGNYRGLVKVTDSYPPGLNEAPTLSGKDGIGRVDPMTSPLTALFDIPEFATYQIFDIEVGGNLPPVADLDVSSETVESGCSIDLFPGPGTSDPDGNNIVLYEYDFDYDGTNFTVDASNTTGEAVTHRFDNPGSSNITYRVAMRVTDDGIPPMSGIDSLIITVQPYALSLAFVNDPTEMTQMGWWVHATNHDPALCLEDDNHVVCTAIQWDYAGPGSNNDCKSSCFSNNGLTWWHDGTSIGTTWRLGLPIKTAADRGDIDSYSYFGWNNGGSSSGNFVCKGDYPYEYAWFSIPFDHRNEIYGSKATGYIFVFGDSGNELTSRRGTTQHIVQDSWALVTTDVTDTDPRLSFVRSIDEDSTGVMFLGYFNNDMKNIKSLKSNDSMGTGWTEGSIWDGSSGTYANVMDPGVDIDEDDIIHVSFLRQDTSTAKYQVCYIASTDGGTTFNQPMVAAESDTQILHAPIVHKTMGCHSVVLIPYAENGDINMSLSWDGGETFTSGIIISDKVESELNPDLILDSNGDLIFAWELNDPTYNGSIYFRKAQLLVN